MITVITVSFNAVHTIEQTIRSVVFQTYPHIEYIIIDGGSGDGTAETVASYEWGLSYWESKSDNGIADAMNKGLARATGEYVLYLNADDYLLDSGAMERVVGMLEGDLVAAPIIKRELDDRERLVAPRGFNWWINFKTGLFHQATFCARHMLVTLDGFDTRLNLTMDYDLFLRAYRGGFSVSSIDRPLSVMRSGGVSTRNDRASLRRRLIEERAIHDRHCPNRFMKVVYSLYWMVYPRYRMWRAIDR